MRHFSTAGNNANKHGASDQESARDAGWQEMIVLILCLLSPVQRKLLDDRPLQYSIGNENEFDSSSVAMVVCHLNFRCHFRMRYLNAWHFPMVGNILWHANVIEM